MRQLYVLLICGVQVDMTWTSFNSGDVFLLDLGQMIYVWNGKDSSRTERFKVGNWYSNTGNQNPSSSSDLYSRSTQSHSLDNPAVVLMNCCFFTIQKD